ncbi:MAG: winged helix-turn-helix transcriptional regulator [Arenicella sp.]|nr:winged helix-turn-helix transcriptional regulator [Arenicella sp.]
MNTERNSTASERLNTVAGNDKKSQLTLGLLQAIEQKDNISQRHLAQEMGVALGLANSYLKRCVKKGWIKITTAPANRYLYYLTPNGFAEKARLTADFSSTSLALFRQSDDEYSAVFDHCVSVGSTRVVLAGLSDLTEIAVMRAMQSKVELVAIYQPGSQRHEFFGVPIVAQSIECDSFDAIVLTSMEQTRQLALELEALYGAEKLVVPAMLLNMNYRNPLMTEQDSNLA